MTIAHCNLFRDNEILCIIKYNSPLSDVVHILFMSYPLITRIKFNNSKVYYFFLYFSLRLPPKPILTWLRLYLSIKILFDEFRTSYFIPKNVANGQTNSTRCFRFFRISRLCRNSYSIDLKKGCCPCVTAFFCF